jgi:hypothetical protein
MEYKAGDRFTVSKLTKGNIMSLIRNGFVFTHDGKTARLELLNNTTVK